MIWYDMYVMTVRSSTMEDLMLIMVVIMLMIFIGTSAASPKLIVIHFQNWGRY